MAPTYPVRAAEGPKKNPGPGHLWPPILLAATATDLVKRLPIFPIAPSSESTLLREPSADAIKLIHDLPIPPC